MGPIVEDQLGGDLRVAFLERRNGRRDDALSNSDRRRNLHVSTWRQRILLDDLANGRRLSQDRLCVNQDTRAGLGDSKAARRALDELNAETFFQQRHLFARGGLGQAQPIGRLREAGAVGDFGKDREPSKVVNCQQYRNKESMNTILSMEWREPSFLACPRSDTI